MPLKMPDINLNTDGGIQRTNDRPGQPEESGKPEFNQKQSYFIKLYIKSGSNKPNRVAR